MTIIWSPTVPMFQNRLTFDDLVKSNLRNPSNIKIIFSYEDIPWNLLSSNERNSRANRRKLYKDLDMSRRIQSSNSPRRAPQLKTNEKNFFKAFGLAGAGFFVVWLISLLLGLAMLGLVCWLIWNAGLWLFNQNQAPSLEQTSAAIHQTALYLNSWPIERLV